MLIYWRMQITVKVKYRSTRKSAAEQRNPDTMTRGASPLEGVHSQTLIGPCGSGACNDEKLGTTSGVNSMSHFFDLPKKLADTTNNSSPVSIGGAENLETPFSLQQ